MSEIVHATVQLYRHALLGTWKSLKNNWLLVPAVVMLAGLMLFVTGVAMSLGLLGGLLLGAANAFVVGALLSLIEQAVINSRRMV